MFNLRRFWGTSPTSPSWIFIEIVECMHLIIKEMNSTAFFHNLSMIRFSMEEFQILDS